MSPAHLQCIHVCAASGWTQYYTSIYHGTVVLNYICAALFFLFFLSFCVFQGGISKHLNMCKWCA